MWQRTEAQAIFLAMYAPYYGLCNSSGSLAMFTAIRRASSLLSNLARAFGTKRTSKPARYQLLRNSSGSLAMFTAIPRALAGCTRRARPVLN